MAEGSTTAAAAASVLPDAEVELTKTEVVAPEATSSLNPDEEQKDKEEAKPADTEMKDDGPTLNGDAATATEPEASSSIDKAQEASAEDVEMKDADATDGAAASTVEPVTPAPAKKAPNGSAKKKAAGVPEHKSKKLNKKKSKPVLRLDAQPGELYLARMKGHQAWPSIICDEEMLPQSLLSSRPVTTALADGTFKKPEYAPGGKREAERTFPVMFLFTNEFAWLPNTELTPLTPEECKDIPEKGKSKGLLEAYNVAAEGNDLAFYKNVLMDHQQALDEDAERRAEREAKKAEKATKAKRKSEAAIADDDDMDVDEEGESKPKPKKRKKSMVDDDIEEKPAKTPKTGAKLKLTTPKTPTVEASGKKKTPKVKASAKKSAAKAARSDDELDTPKLEEKTLTPAEAKDKKEKEIRYYRHKLQKGFITRDYTPGEEEIKAMSGYLQKLESYPDLEGSIIRLTKINKVLKAMIRLPSIPKDEEFGFKKRSQDLLGKWNIILNSDTAGADGDKDGDKEDKDTDKEKEKEKDEPKAETNGVKESAPAEATDAASSDKEKDETEDAPKAESAAAPEKPKSSKPEHPIGTGIEGAKEAEPPATESSKPAEDAETDEPSIEKPAEAYEPPAETAEATA